MHVTPQHPCSWPLGGGMWKIPAFPAVQPQLQPHLLVFCRKQLPSAFLPLVESWRGGSVRTRAAQKCWLYALGRPRYPGEPRFVLQGFIQVQTTAPSAPFFTTLPRQRSHSSKTSIRFSSIFRFKFSPEPLPECFLTQASFADKIYMYLSPAAFRA